MKLKELLQLHLIDPEKLLICNCSLILDRDTVPEQFLMYNLGLLAPTAMLVNIYTTEGASDAYILRYMSHIKMLTSYQPSVTDKEYLHHSIAFI